MKALFVLLVLPLTQCILVEWYTLDGRRADPCVNIQKLDADVGRLDCADNTRLPPPATTYLLPSQDSPATRRLADNVQLTFTGRNLQTGFLRLAPQGQESCNTIDTAIPSQAATANDKRTQITFNVAGFVQFVPVSNLPRYLCYSTTEAGIYQWTGIRIGTVWNCDDNSDQAANKCAAYVAAIPADRYPDPKWQRIEMARTKCCSSATNQGQTTIRPGQCINPNVEKCCGATALSQNQKCCSTTAESSAWIDGVCPCVRESAATDCPAEESCCLASKYADLAAPNNNIYFEKDNGECYNWKSHRCCDTGKRYDPGSQQCCTINGLQSINTPCPCSSDAHCQGGQSGLKLTDQKCCFQTAPTPLELINNNQANTCSRFNNFPSGQGETSTQRCIGTCFDSRYQICCNGATCNLEYDACCNSTCCNQFTGACRQGFRPGTPGVPYNWNSYREVFDVCTKIEQLNHVNVFWVFIMPTALLIAVILSLAISLVFANRVEHKARRGLEKLLLIAALITILTAIPTFFAPVYKYGVVIIFSGFFTIIAVAARKIPVYAATAVILFVVIFYTWDPFHGNDYLNLSSDRVVNGRPDPASAGLLHSIQKMHSDPESCALFYDYFRLDPQNRDIARVDNPNIVTFGYCSRGWITNLLYFSGFCMIGVFTQFILIVIALLVRGGFLREQAEAAYAAAYQSAFGHH